MAPVERRNRFPRSEFRSFQKAEFTNDVRAVQTRDVRIASSIAKEEKAHGIVTGESIRQVANQTTQNLFAIDQAFDVPVYRPQIGLDKTESIKLARRIDIYRLSTEGDPAACNAAYRHPATNSDLDEVNTLEASVIDFIIAASESLTWQRVFPDPSFRWVFCPDHKR